MELKLPVILSSFDLERIDRLLEENNYRNTPYLDGLRHKMSRASVVQPQDVPEDVVIMNSRVQFVDDVSGNEYNLTLTYPGSAKAADTVSILAPVGAALLGMSVGQSISWEVPGVRTLQLRVLGVACQAELPDESSL